MGQFKPMVKMETTEPSVILKLKNGGHVAMKKGGSTTEAKKMAFGGLPSMPMSNKRMPPDMADGAPTSGFPKKPSMASRRKSMMSMKAPVTPVMKKGGDADMAQDKAMIKKAMKKHSDMPASKAHKGLKTGGVAMGQGGYKNGGGIIPVKDSEIGAKGYVDTKMVTTKKGTKTGATGEVKKGNGGGYAKGGGVNDNVSSTPAGVTNTKTGGVRLGNAGGYRKGGATKKFADGGAVQNDGRPVKMPQGNKRVPTPVSINQLSGTYRKGGTVKKMAMGGKTVGPTQLPSYVKDLPSNMPPRKMTPVVQQPRVTTPSPARIPTKQVMSGSAIQSKPKTIMSARKGGATKKFADGGDAQLAKNQMEYKQYEEDERKFNEGLRDDVKDALMYIPRKASALARKVGKEVSNSDFAKGARNYGRLYKEGLGMKPDTPYEKNGGAIKKRSGGKC